MCTWWTEEGKSNQTWLWRLVGVFTKMKEDNPSTPDIND